MRVFSFAVLALAVLGGLAGAAGAGGPALSVVVVGVRPGPYSATISWQTSAPATVLVEYGLSEDYGVWTRRIASGPDRAGRSALAVLEPTREYRFRVIARAGRARAEATGALTTSPQPLRAGVDLS